MTASDGCTPAEGEYVTDVALTYAADTQTITLTCTTAPVVPGLGNGR